MNTKISHELPRFSGEVGAIKVARKKRMRLAWSVWFVSAVFVLFQFFLQLSSGEMINGLMSSFALTAFGGGVLASSYYYIYVSLQTPAGMLMDRYGLRIILSAGAFIAFLGCVLFSTAKSVFIALLGRILMGGGAAFAFVGCLNLISIWFPARRFAFMTAIVETAGMIGVIVGSFWLAEVIRHIGWRNGMLFSGFFSAILSVFLALIIRDAPRKKKSAKNKTDFSELKKGLTELLRMPVIWMNGVYSGLLFSVVTTFTALWGIPFLEIAHHVHIVKASLTDAALYAGVAVGGPMIGWLDGHTFLRRQLMIMLAIAAAVCLFFVIFVPSLSLITVAILLFFAGICASSYVLTFAIVNEMSTPRNRATSIGLTNTLCVLFAPILQPLVGLIVTGLNHHDHLSANLSASLPHFEWAVSMIPFLLLIAALLAYFLPSRASRRLSVKTHTLTINPFK